MTDAFYFLLVEIEKAIQTVVRLLAMLSAIKMKKILVYIHGVSKNTKSIFFLKKKKSKIKDKS